MKLYTKYIYLINIIDHFSRYINSYLLEKKISILLCIKEFIEEKGVPMEFGTDNGKEFIKISKLIGIRFIKVNSTVIEYLTSKNIKC